MAVDVTALRAEYVGPHELVEASDGATLFVRRWEARGVARAGVLVFHGITGYSAPYGPMMAEEVAAAGYDVFGLDLRGHGLSDGRRGDYPSAERLAKDLSEAVAAVKGRSRRLVLLGHSLGALTAVRALKGSPGAADGLVLVSAARKIRTGVYPKPSAGAALKAMLGATILKGTPLIEYCREGQAGLEDPLFNFRYSARFYSLLYGAGALKVMGMMRSGMIDSPNLSFGGKLGVPLFVGVGEKDELFSEEAVQDFCSAIECDDKEFHVFPGASHASFPRGSWSPLTAWMDKRF